MAGNYTGRRCLYFVQSRIQGSSERHKEGSRLPGESQAPIRCTQMQERGSIGDSPQRLINPHQLLLAQVRRGSVEFRYF